MASNALLSCPKIPMPSRPVHTNASSGGILFMNSGDLWHHPNRERKIANEVTSRRVMTALGFGFHLVAPFTTRYFKTVHGVQVQELVEGEGEAAARGSTVVIDYVLRRANGYFIYSTVEGVSFQPLDVPTAPYTFTLGQANVIPGLQEVVAGMKVGGKRRALIPASQAYGSDIKLEPQPPTYATQRQLLNHAKEPLLFEVKLLKFR